MIDVRASKLPVRHNLLSLMLLFYNSNPLKGLTKLQCREDSEDSQKAFDKVLHKSLLRNLARGER